MKFLAVFIFAILLVAVLGQATLQRENERRRIRIEQQKTEMRINKNMIDAVRAKNDRKRDQVKQNNDEIRRLMERIRANKVTLQRRSSEVNRLQKEYNILRH